MKDRFQEVITEIEKNHSEGWLPVIRNLQQCESVGERISALLQIYPSLRHWSLTNGKRLLFYLHQKYGLNVGVCSFFCMEGERQYCNVKGKREECICTIPEPYCPFRDTDGKPKYPEFLFMTFWTDEDDGREIIHGLGHLRRGTWERQDEIFKERTKVSINQEGGSG